MLATTENKKNIKKIKKAPITEFSLSDNKKVDEEDKDIAFIADLANEVNDSVKGLENKLVPGEQEDAVVPYWIRTNIPALDYAIGGYNHPGIPGGRIIEIFGWEGAGKSTLATHITKCAMSQLNTFCVYQDAERVLTDEIIEGTQINMKKVVLQHPDTLEEVFDSQEAIIDVVDKREKENKESIKPFIIVMDSIASCSTKAEIEAQYGDPVMGVHARIMSQSLRKIKAPITNHQILSIFVNQIREKIGVMFGKQYETFGGKALKFYASVRLELTRTSYLKNKSGATVKVVVIKNKVAPPQKEATFDILFKERKGFSYPEIDVYGALLDWCREHEIIGGSQTSGRYEIDGKKLYKEDAKRVLQANKKLYNELLEKAYSVKNPKDILEEEKVDE